MRFLHVIGAWINEYFSHEEAIYLVVFIATMLIVLATLGGYLAPVITGLVIAFLLQGLVSAMERIRVPRALAVVIAFLVFLGLVFALALIVVPLLWQQLQELLALLPTAILRLREGVAELAVRFPEYVTPEQVSAALDQGAGELANLSASVVETAFSQVFSLLSLVLYIGACAYLRVFLSQGQG